MRAVEGDWRCGHHGGQLVPPALRYAVDEAVARLRELARSPHPEVAVEAQLALLSAGQLDRPAGHG